MKKICGLLLLIYTSLSLGAELSELTPNKSLSLQEAVLLSLRHNPNVQSQQYQRISDKFSLRVAQYNFDWQYGLTGSAKASSSRVSGVSSNTSITEITPTASRNGKYGTKYDIKMSNPSSSGVYNPGLDFKVSQPLMRGFGKDVTLAPLYNAKDTEEISKLTLQSTVEQTVLDVIRDYRTIIQSQNNLHTTALSLQGYKDTIRLDKALIKAGRKAPSEVLQAQSQYASERVTYEDNKVNVANNKLSLIQNIGLEPTTDYLIPNNINHIQKIIPNVEQCYQTALLHNPQYLQNQLNIKVAERNLLVARDSARMQVDLTLDASTGNGTGSGSNSGFNSLSNNKNSALTMGLDVTVPINDLTLRQGIIDARVALDQAQITLAQNKRDLKTTIINDINNIKSQWKQIELAEEALKLQQQNQNILLAKLKFGLVSSFEVTTKQQDLDNARRQVIENKISYLNNLTQLYLDMGILLEKWDITLRY